MFSERPVAGIVAQHSPGWGQQERLCAQTLPWSISPVQQAPGLGVMPTWAEHTAAQPRKSLPFTSLLLTRCDYRERQQMRCSVWVILSDN